MFSSIVRLGIAFSCAVLLSSCGGGSGQALTQQNTPEGLFTGSVADTANQTQNVLLFVEYNGTFYAFYSDASAMVNRVATGSFSFAGGGMAASGALDIILPVASTSGGAPSLQAGTVSNPSFGGAYITGQNITGTFSYPTSTPPETIAVNLPYNIAYQNTQNLSTLAGTYTGKVATTTTLQDATFTFGTASVLANSGNQFGVANVTGTGADGCIYTGTVSPLFKGNGYNLTISSGNAPCTLPNTQFSGLIYLDNATNRLYSFAPDASHSDGLIFIGSKL